MNAVAAARSLIFRRSNLNHGLHAALTLLSLGLWLPIWVAMCLSHEGWKSGHNWTLAGKTGVGLSRIERLQLEPEQLRRMAHR
ncbi:MAG TPA: hypothetical protein PKB11_04640 [Desulfovibrio sp.]|jgi:hypothetical protein|uniref:hypothetical protein n=1 Tax=Desulfovibrio TaxID=872 RepID=UPI00041128DA|nr:MULTISPECIES: hypothetical protein [Desulfovibrio]MDY0305970.1 hypothetical protein [Desulfovibrionaceae bacterium]HMM38024.1 hypothetical protein [Desulfovibrio sp.]